MTFRTYIRDFAQQIDEWEREAIEEEKLFRETGYSSLGEIDDDPDYGKFVFKKES